MSVYFSVVGVGGVFYIVGELFVEEGGFLFVCRGYFIVEVYCGVR